jgi:hypothetical protein
VHLSLSTNMTSSLTHTSPPAVEKATITQRQGHRMHLAMEQDWVICTRSSVRTKSCTATSVQEKQGSPWERATQAESRRSRGRKLGYCLLRNGRGHARSRGPVFLPPKPRLDCFASADQDSNPRTDQGQPKMACPGPAPREACLGRSVQACRDPWPKPVSPVRPEVAYLARS